MRSLATSALLLLLASAPATAADEPAVKVALALRGQPRIDNQARLAAARDLGLEVLRTSNYNTASHPDVLKASVPEIHARYRAAVAGDYLLITFPRPVHVQTTGGGITVSEVVIGLGAEYANALFTIDQTGRVVEQAKYDGGRSIRLRDAVNSLLAQVAKEQPA